MVAMEETLEEVEDWLTSRVVCHEIVKQKKCKAFKCVWTLHPHLEKLNKNMYKEGI